MMRLVKKLTSNATHKGHSNGKEGANIINIEPILLVKVLRIATFGNFDTVIALSMVDVRVYGKNFSTISAALRFKRGYEQSARSQTFMGSQYPFQTLIFTPALARSVYASVLRI